MKPKRSKNRRAGFKPKPKTPRHKRGPALMAKPTPRKPSKRIREIYPDGHPRAGEMIPRAGDKKVHFYENGPVYLRLGNSKKGKKNRGTILRL